MKRILAVSCVVVALCGTVYFLIPPGEDAAEKLDRAEAEAAKEVQQIEASAAGGSFALDATNTKIGFSCAKDLAGKTMTVHGGWSERFGSTLSGQVLVDDEGQQIQQITAAIDIKSVWSEHDQLTDALLTKGFFQVQDHPTGTFVSTSIRSGAPEESTLKDATHVIEGNFSLNGIEKSITFPARIELSESGLKLESQFSLNRKDFNANFTDTAGFGLLTDENISHLVALKLSVDAASAQPSKTDSEVVSTGDPGDAAEAAAEVDVSQLAQTYTETIPATQVEFSMTLVPGDAAKGISPLYFGTHEVTWDEFMPFVDGRDVEDPDELGELRALKLRPSPPYGSVDRNFGMDQRPALGMSLLSAELYCKWLSEQTGKTYRLPTEAEWDHAYVTGGGDSQEPLSAEMAKEVAVYDETSWDDNIGDWASKPVGSMQPDKTGLMDLAGNVCEWVTDTGSDKVARGGHYDGERELLGVGRHIEDPDWNRDYPNDPKSIWWFVNARWIGFRVVCEISGP